MLVTYCLTNEEVRADFKQDPTDKQFKELIKDMKKNHDQIDCMVFAFPPKQIEEIKRFMRKILLAKFVREGDYIVHPKKVKADYVAWMIDFTHEEEEEKE